MSNYAKDGIPSITGFILTVARGDAEVVSPILSSIMFEANMEGGQSMTFSRRDNPHPPCNTEFCINNFGTENIYDLVRRKTDGFKFSSSKIGD